MFPTAQYASDVVKGKIVAGPLVRLACQRHLNDLKDGHKRGLRFDEALAARAIGFFPDVLRLSEGEHAGQPFNLEPSQKFIVGSLFGWIGADGYRRFRTAYVEIGKGNGKSPLAGGIGLYMLVADSEASAECYAAATTREQASILFQDAVKMVDSSPALSARIQKSGNRAVFNLAHLASGSYFRPVSSEGKGLDGKRVHYAALDEVHEHPTAVVVDKIRAGTKGRRQALIFEITNSGFGRHSVCWNHHEYSRHILEGTAENDSWFAYVCGLDEGDDWRNPKVWPKANPLLDVSITKKYLQEQVREADGMPSKENIVKRLNFCIWTEQSTRWIPLDKWDLCADPVNEEALRGRACWAGLDLSRVADLSALCLAFPGEDGVTDLLWRIWIPEDTIEERSKRDKVPYREWRDKGLIIATPGNVVDYDFIEAEILRLASKFDIRQIAIDRTFGGELIQHLQAEMENEYEKDPEKKRIFEHGQGFMSMFQPTADFEKRVIGQQFRHGGYPPARWAMGNTSVKTDPAGCIKPDKEKSTERIDPIVAAIMASGRASAYPAVQYTSPTVLTV